MIKRINSYDNILTYLEKSKIRLRNKNLPANDIRNYNAKKLEGIQAGIPVFENLSMAQIIQIVRDKIEFVIKRGCSNMCTHCYADAKPEIYHLLQNKATTISIEDANNFFNGFKELSKRLNFNILGYKGEYATLFHDADASTVFLKDKTGKTLDYLDLADKIHELTNSPILFDTSGWNIQDKTTQKRMEAFVEKAKNGNYEFIEFNISINPFSPFYEKSLKNKSAGNIEKERKYRNIYTNRMANVIFTLTPLLDKKETGFILRAFQNNYDNMSGYTKKDLKKLKSEIIQKVYQMYIKDYNTAQKVISSKDQIGKYTKLLKAKTKEISTNLGMTGRLLKTFKDKLLPQHTKPKKIEKSKMASIIDINGKVYFTDFKTTINPNIQLNYLNKDCQTPAISPEIQEIKSTWNNLYNHFKRKK